MTDQSWEPETEDERDARELAEAEKDPRPLAHIHLGTIHQMTEVYERVATYRKGCLFALIVPIGPMLMFPPILSLFIKGGRIFTNYPVLLWLHTFYSGSTWRDMKRNAQKDIRLHATILFRRAMLQLFGMLVVTGTVWVVVWIVIFGMLGIF